jgi:predicted NBD/HSP70 family sugar kinase
MRTSDREHNRLRVLRALRRAEPIGRTDLANLAGLDGGTITEISSSLLNRSLILEEKIPTGRRGRPQLHLRLNPEGAYALAAYIGIAGQLVCEIVDLRGGQLYLSSSPIGITRSLQEFADRIATLVEETLDASGYGKSSISRIGIALPAVVDSDNGVVHWMQTLDAPPYPAARLIEDRLGIPVAIDNNTNVLARAEHWFGDHVNLDDFSIFNLGYGISAAHYFSGQLYAGAHGLNSETGHSKIVVDDGRPCVCGAQGCLDAYCSITALIQQGCEATAMPMPDIFDYSEALVALAQQARDGRKEIVAVFERASRYLGFAMANHINALDPGRIILLCEHPDLPEIFASAAAIAQENCLPPLKGLTTIEFRAFEQDLFRKGAAALVLEQLYRSL